MMLCDVNQQIRLSEGMRAIAETTGSGTGKHALDRRDESRIWESLAEQPERMDLQS